MASSKTVLNKFPKGNDVGPQAAQKTAARKSPAINQGVNLPTTGTKNPMADIKNRSDGKHGGAVC